jgi:dihydrofolate synthase/folylpolyglutamate synthase
MSSHNAYQETIEYLFGLQKYGVKLGLSNSVRLLELMGAPQHAFRSVHIAGTNGKGSTAAFITGMLQAAGHRVGLYTSPHLVSFTERMRINGVQISEAKVVELAQRVRERASFPVPGSGTAVPTFFEVTTAMAFTWFAEQQVDLAVIETGMGGRLDATNVITPLLSVITNIDLEHTEFLGTTLELIAAEKAGIIKQGVPVVTGVVQPEVVAVLEREATGKQAPLYLLGKDFAPESVVAGRTQVFDYRGHGNSYSALEIGMLGRYQVDNACLAMAAMEVLQEAGVAVDEAAMRRGLANTRWEGRLERVAERPDIFLDGAHNPASATQLAAAVRAMRPSYQRLVLIIGILGDKDRAGILSQLLPLADLVIVTKPNYSRAMDVEALATEVRQQHGTVETTGTVAAAIALARHRAAPDDLVLITGSLYVVGDARAEFSGPDLDAPALAGLKG